MNCKSYILLLLSCLYGLIGRSQTIEFVENKGQWDDRVRYMGQVSNGAFFIHKDGFTVLQYNPQDWQRLHDAIHNHTLDGKPASGPVRLRSHAYRVDFLNANAKLNMVADKPLDTYNNYFIGNDPSKWASNCRIYQGITLQNVYPNIDVRYYTDNGTLKYDLIVKPGGNPSDIALRYDGADGLKVKNRELVIGTSVGELRELEPYSYQYNERGRAEVQAKFVVKENVVRFDVRNYDPKTTLVIDPTLIFCSFSGSTADNWGFTATYGPDGSMYGGGIVFGQGFPVNTGAADESFNGGGSGGCFGGNYDIGVMKLTPNGNARVYATYIGGNMQEMPQSLIVDGSGDLIVAGRSNSSDYPLQGGLFIGPNGLPAGRSDYDIVITKLNAAGSALIGSRKIGGIGEDGANITPCGGSEATSLQRNYGDEARSEVNIDRSGNIYLASCTQSPDFPIRNGFQTVKGALQDGVVLKFNPDLSNMLFSSFLGGTGPGGTGNDAAYVLSISPTTGQIYVAGGTESTDLPGSTAGTISPTNNGAIDGFVSIISADGSSIIKTSYVGTSDIDQIYGIQFDRLGFPYIMGQTTGNWPVLNATWSQTNGRQFIAKLRPDLSAFVYSTKFGKGEAAPDISPVAFLVDRCENVYVSGWGGRVVSGLHYPTAGVAGLPVTPDAMKSAPDINPSTGLGEDFYFFVLKRNAASQLYGSFFGQNNAGIGDHVDGGTSRFDQNGVIYQAICASCGTSAPFPTYPNPGAYATTKPPGANCNLAMVKIAFNLAGVGSGVQSFIEGVPRDTAGCVPLTVDFRDTVQRAVSYEWNFGDGPQWFTTTTPNNSHTYLAVGTYRVTLVAVDSNSCNIRDTSYLNIKVGANKALLDFNPRKVGLCTAFQYNFENTSFAPPGFPFSGQSFTWIFGDGSNPVTTGSGTVNHAYASPGTYTVKLILHDTSYCNSPDTLVKTLRVASLVKAQFETPPTGCAPYTAVFNNTSLAGSDFIWDFGDGDTSHAVSPTHLYGTPGTYLVVLIANDTGTCNKTDTTRFTITVLGKPTANFTANPQPPQLNTPITFTNQSSPDAVGFKWIFGDGDSLVTTSRAPVQHEYNATRTYDACLVARNVGGCPDTFCTSVRMLIEPAVDVPNAFTPAQGGVNGIVYVRGFGIAKMKFSIYARWGEKVFESTSKNVGWDGMYKGKLLPMDVYAYTLEVEFSDGTKATKTGDITLIR